MGSMVQGSIMPMMDMSNGPGMTSMGNMNMRGMGMSSMDGMMMPTFFYTGIASNPLWFQSWLPKSSLNMALACLGLFALAAFSKLLSSTNFHADSFWAAKDQQNSLTSASDASELEKSERAMVNHNQQGRSWSLARALTRGFFTAVIASLNFFLMLAVMSFNALFFISIILGLFVGETLFWGEGTSAGDH